MNFWNHQNKLVYLSLSIVLVLFFAFFYATPVLTLFNILDSMELRQSYFPISIAISQYLFLLLPILLIMKFTNLNYKDFFKFKIKFHYKVLFVSLLGLIASRFFGLGFITIQSELIPESIKAAYIESMRNNLEFYMTFLKADNFLGLLLVIFIGALTPAIVEELVFRGFLLKMFTDRLKIFTSFLLSSFVFAIIHFNLIDISGLFMFGIILAYTAYYTRSITIPILLHFLNNLFSLLIINILPKEEILSFEDSISFEVAIAVLIISSVSLGIVFHSLKKYHKWNL